MLPEISHSREREGREVKVTLTFDLNGTDYLKTTPQARPRGRGGIITKLMTHNASYTAGFRFTLKRKSTQMQCNNIVLTVQLWEG